MLSVEPDSGVVLIGSTSEIGHALLKILKPKSGTPLLLVGRDPDSRELVDYWPGDVRFIECDLTNVTQICQTLHRIKTNYKIDFAIITSAFLPEEFQDDDFDSVLKTFTINSSGTALILSGLANMMKVFGGTIVFISSVACVRPRVRNFTYGASKASSDFFAIGLSAKFRNSDLNIKVIRPGFVYSKLSKGFQIAPFATSPRVVAENIIRGLVKSNTVIYSPPILRIAMGILRILPGRIFHSL